MSAPALPLAWLPSIGGLLCDFVGRDGSVWPEGSPDHGIARLDDGRWFAQLPMGSGYGVTLKRALARARVDQHARLRAEREQGIADATAEHYEARARRLGAVTLEGEGLVLLREPAIEPEAEQFVEDAFARLTTGGAS